MDKRIRNLSNNIMEGKMLEESIPQVFHHIASTYNLYAGVRLSLHYYTLYEYYCDTEGTWDGEANEMLIQINKMVEDNISKTPQDIEASLEIIDTMRNKIMRRMQVISSYTDIFRIYEYILNRLEYQFIDEGDEVIDDEEFAKEILRFIFGNQDSVIVNSKIQDVISQLPIRITKQKYFDIIKDSLTNYLGGEQESLDTYLYLIRSSAMLYKIEGMETDYPQLWEYKEKLSGLRYKGISKSEFDMVSNTLQEVSERLEVESTVYFSLQEIVNEIYSILLCYPYLSLSEHMDERSKQAHVAFEIISEINKIFMLGDRRELPTNIVNKFEKVEGIQEDLSYDIPFYEGILYEVQAKHKELSKSLFIHDVHEKLQRVNQLLSNSLFIEFGEEAGSGVVNQDKLDAETDKLIQEMNELFKSHDRVVQRAVMANTLGRVPVFFKNHTEVMDYVRYAVEKCTDSGEKRACVDLINQIMEE